MNVTRRTALKVIGAALLAPCVQLRPSIDREALLHAFCDPELRTIRYDISSPFSVEEYVYSTDDKHIVRAVLPGHKTDGERQVPDVLRVYREAWHPTKWSDFSLPPWHRANLLESHDKRMHGICPACGDRRIWLGQFCPTVEPPREWLYDPDDNTRSDPSCELCHGQTYFGPSILNVCGVNMEYWRLHPIAALPSVRVCQTVYASPGYKPEKALLFQADGFEGIAMGVLR